MLHYLWSAMILCGIVFGVCTGKTDAVGTAAVTSAREAVELAVTMLGVMAMWTGLMAVAKSCGIMDGLSRLLRKPVHFLFPGVPEGHPAQEFITANMLANLLGLGWAATPAGLKAMQHMSEIHRERCKESGKSSAAASSDMCTFLVINISSLQLIPVNIIAYRSQYGSVNPAAIIGPAILATLVSTAVAIVFCKIMARRR